MKTKPHLLSALGCLAALQLAGSPSHAQDNAALRAQDAPPNAIWLDSLDLRNVVQDWGQPHAGRSVEGHPLTLNGVVYPHGLGTHANSAAAIDLKGNATKFEAMAGVDEEKNNGSVQFIVTVDGQEKIKTKIIHGGDPAVPISVDLTGAKRLILEVGDAGDGITNDHADWAGALITLASGATDKPATTADTADGTPMSIYMGGDSPVPAIHGPRVVGTTPGHDFLFLVPATGAGPLTFGAKNLPDGLTLNPKTGIISGSLKEAGPHETILTVTGPQGTGSRALRIIGGEHLLALTPPMGWNSWNVWANKVDDGKVRAAADQMIAAGLAAHGFQYVNVDDCWQAGRDANGVIQGNERFPDMKALAEYVHGKGLRMGIYSSPGPKTCGGYTGSWQHEQQDADTYASWHMDYLKYDWCSFGDVATGEGVERAIKPYRVMGEALRKTDRDIIFSLCQYGNADVWTWGESIGGNCWRTTDDIQDNWGSLSGIFKSQNGHEKYAGPGHWNDPDMLMVGVVGFGNTHPTRLKPNEQITHISMWSILSAPLLIGCDLTRLDPYTKALLTNDEVLDIDQDPLGKPAGRVIDEGQHEVWARPLWDGTHAVALVNLSLSESEVSVPWSALGISGPQPVRDLWQRKDMGAFPTEYKVSIPAHGTVLIKVGKPNQQD